MHVEIYETPFSKELRAEIAFDGDSHVMYPAQALKLAGMILELVPKMGLADDKALEALKTLANATCELIDSMTAIIPEDAWPHFDVGNDHLREGLAELEPKEKPDDSG